MSADECGTIVADVRALVPVSVEQEKRASNPTQHVGEVSAGKHPVGKDGVEDGWIEVGELVVSHEEPDRLQVEATVVRDPLEARDDGGWLLRTPARSDRVTLELVRQEGRWLLWSWSGAG